MVFIVVLILAAMSIAGSAAFFSVYGLANTFGGTFYSVVVMGASLEAGKLIAASYLYRYWKKTHVLLKGYMMLGIFALMVLTSVGIFGYLSAGYQTDTLPLKQIQQQVQILDGEKAHLLERKKQIDIQIAQLPTNVVRGRTQLMKGFKDEQTTTTNRIAQLDKDTLELKQKQIQTEAHIGPITYIAKAFDADVDNATKYMIFLIIFAFDPMAVALTLSVNIAQRVRREEMEAAKLSPPTVESTPVPPLIIEEPILHAPEPSPDIISELPTLNPEPELEGEPTPEPEPEPEHSGDPLEKQPPALTAPPVLDLPAPTRYVRPYTGIWNDEPSGDKITELLNHHRLLKAKQNSGDSLSKDEHWELLAIEDVLKRHGYNIYI